MGKRRVQVRFNLGDRDGLTSDESFESYVDMLIEGLRGLVTGRKAGRKKP